MEEISIIGAKERERDRGPYRRLQRSDLLVSLRVKSLLNFDSKKGDENSAKIYADWRVKVASGARDFFGARNWPI